ncbi:MAG: hypothetical protein JW838_14880 [Spirochaetes bacterium]|nr:hypothetical protein [Spirochaetota bacterium]
MDDKQAQLIASGYPQGSGQKSRFVFSCMSCGASVATENEYATGEEGTLQGALKDQARYGLSSMLYRIPVIGYFLSSMLSRKMSERESSGQAKRMEESRAQAFNEIRGRFSTCTQCGAYACPSCFSEGLCSVCRQTRNAGRMAADAQGEAGAQGQGEGTGDPKDPTKMWD